jgi:hypothetical protein
MQGSYIYTLTHTYIVRENKIVLVSVSEGTKGGGSDKENAGE